MTGFERPPAPPSPPPEPRRKERTSTTEIDIHDSRGDFELDIRRSSSKAASRAPTKAPSRAPSRAPSPTPTQRTRGVYHEDDRVLITNDRMEVRRRRSISAKPQKDLTVDIRHSTKDEIPPSRWREDDSEAAFYKHKADERAYIGEAYRGATKDWGLVDVPPGTERVVLDGVGGASQEITWQRYNGMRRSRFINERDDPSPEPPSPPPRPKSTGMELEIRTRTREREPGGDAVYKREYERIEETGVGFPLTPPPRAPSKRREKDLWTEITKDLVIREAIEELGYDFDETPEYFYIISYLRYVSLIRARVHGGWLTCIRRTSRNSSTVPTLSVASVNSVWTILRASVTASSVPRPRPKPATSVTIITTTRATMMSGSLSARLSTSVVAVAVTDAARHHPWSRLDFFTLLIRCARRI